ncbi:MAG TPA: right-handed parallel beta-helix repeat-containing protein [Oculatellaceae cyanobacterium]
MNTTASVVRSMKPLGALLLLIFITALRPQPSFADVLSVGPDKPFTKPSLAAAAAKKGDTIEIAPGIYTEDCAVWNADNLTIKGLGQRPVINAKGEAADDKGIWVIKGDNTIIDNIEFTGCTDKNRNGAGIRQEGRNLTLTNCSFHDNENGVYIDDNPQSDVRIDYCEFSHNGYGNGQSYNIYVNYIHSLELKGCYIHDAKAGDNVKSRAQTNFILYNRIADDDSSVSALPLNFPNGGACYVVGNVIRKAAKTSIPVFVAMGSEGAKNSKQKLYLINNTIANAKKSSTLNNVRKGAALFKAQGGTELRIVNNAFLYVTNQFEGSGTLEMMLVKNNVVTAPGDFADATNLDFHLTSRSDARRAGSSPGFSDGIDLTPRFEYVHPCKVKTRATGGRDVGAFEAEGS